MQIDLTLNGEEQRVNVAPRTHLADLLRDKLRLTGTHLGCEHGVCGACTVLVDGVPTRSCIALAPSIDGATVQTIEGFEQDPLMGELREAFQSEHALQCGYCTPGMLISAYDIARRLSVADENRIRRELAGNLCRCTGYQGIVRAIARVIDNPGAASMTHSTNDHREPPIAVPFSLPPMQAQIEVPVQAAAAQGTTRDGVGSIPDVHQRLRIASSAAKVWGLFQQPAEVVTCLPGARLTDGENAAPDTDMPFEIGVKLGPIRPTFAGSARLTLDQERRGGRLGGNAEDPRTRSKGAGEVEFHLLEIDDSNCELVVDLDYRLEGTLAQFSRGRVVEALLGHLLREFGRNIERKTSANVDSPRPKLESTEDRKSGIFERVKRWWR